MRPGRFRRFRMWDALPPFNGGKRRLAGLIFGAIDRVLPRASWSGLTFVDGFLGGGAIGLFAKAQGFGRVIGIDIALRSVLIGEALIANSRVRLTKDDVTRVLAPRDARPGLVEREMVPHAFTRAQARVIDNALALASEACDPSRAALLRLLAIRIALLAHPFSYVRRGTIGKMTSGEYESITPTALPQYVRGLRLASFPMLWELAKRINGGVFEGRAEVRQGDALQILPTIKADILYADPPYAATRSYEAAYRLIDRMLGEETRPTSPFTARGGAGMIDALLESARRIPLVVLSFGNETVTLQELEQKMIRHGRRARAIEIPYSRLAALSREERSTRDREFLIVGWDEALLGKRPGLDVEVGRSVSGIEIDADLRRPEGSAAQGGLGDLVEQGETTLAENAVPGLGRAPEPQTGVDEPEPVLVEPGLDGGPERSAIGWHRERVPLRGRRSQDGGGR